MASIAASGAALARLLRALNRVDGLEWIRMLYLYPTTITRRRAGRDGGERRRSASTSTCRCSTPRTPVLKRMKRPGTRAGYERLLDRIRTRLPGVTLRTTFIVGFPGETDADFAELEASSKPIGFDHVGRLHLLA